MSSSAQEVQGGTGEDTGPRGRSSAEWVTFVASCLLLAVVGLLAVSLMFGPNDPAAPRAAVAGLTDTAGLRHVSVSVTNEGDDPATNVQVTLEVMSGEPVEGDQVIDFLAGKEVVRLVFIVGPEVREDQVEVRVTGFTEP